MYNNFNVCLKLLYIICKYKLSHDNKRFPLFNGHDKTVLEWGRGASQISIYVCKCTGCLGKTKIIFIIKKLDNFKFLNWNQQKKCNARLSKNLVSG